VPDPVTSSGHPRRRGIRLCLRRGGAFCLTVLLLPDDAPRKSGAGTGALRAIISARRRASRASAAARPTQGKAGDRDGSRQATAVPGATGGACRWNRHRSRPRRPSPLDRGFSASTRSTQRNCSGRHADPQPISGTVWHYKPGAASWTLLLHGDEVRPDAGAAL